MDRLGYDKGKTVTEKYLNLLISINSELALTVDSRDHITADLDKIITLTAADRDYSLADELNFEKQPTNLQADLLRERNLAEHCRQSIDFYRNLYLGTKFILIAHGNRIASTHAEA